MSAKYDVIGLGYDDTRKADTYLLERMCHHLQFDLNGLYLDVGCGTGNYTSALQKKGFDFTGLDPSQKMLAMARERNPEIDWRIGNAEHIPLASQSVDGVLASLTIHHWSDLRKGVQECHRVLKEGKPMALFTATPKQMEGYWLNHYFPNMMQDSIDQMPSFQEVQEAMQEAGFASIRVENYSIREGHQDMFLYCGKHNPFLYLDPTIRQGISSFSSLANKGEVEEGLEELRLDVASGKVREVMNKYENDAGDYMFVIAVK